MSLGGFASGFPDAQWLVDEGARLEALGYENLMVGDRPLWNRPSLEPITTVGLLAGTTSRIRFITILLLPLRNPMILARELAYSDFLSNGRCIVAGALGGDYPEEFLAVGVNPAERVGRFEECIEAMRYLWNGEKGSFYGSYTTIPGDRIHPSPINGNIPIWLAHRARSERSLDRIASISDGWLASWVTVRRLGWGVQQITERAERLGRDPSDIEIAAVVRVYVNDDYKRAVEVTARTRADLYGIHSYDEGVSRAYHALGTSEQCAEKLRAYVDAGVETVVILPECPFAQFDDQVDEITEDVLPAAGLCLTPLPEEA
jgi:alkanesulfonate monooxygenase SsuD/methylene tetrahydromethanopterin reductase-like flavin-dependent oxidoreductase (luciferase family)